MFKEFNKYQKPKILSRDNLSKHDYIKRHCYQNRIIKELYDSKEFFDDQLLYMFNNNTLKRLGFPLKRGGKKKAFKRRRIIRNPIVFSIIDRAIDKRLEQVGLEGLGYKFNQFVDYEDICQKNKNIFNYR